MSDTHTAPLNIDDEGCGDGCACRAGLDRRSVLQGLVAFGAGTALAGPAFAQALTPGRMPPQIGDFLVPARGSADPLTPESIPLNEGPFEAWAQSPDGTVRKSNFENKLVLFRFDPAELTPEVQAVAGGGVVAMAMICTHAGCEVTNYLAGEGGILECPCHGSRFSPKEGGAMVMGPANRKLPGIALIVEDGKLKVASEFDSRVGGDEAG